MILVRPAAASRGILHFGGRAVPCALGRGGVRSDKREGDGATPAGSWPLRRVLYRPDRVALPPTGLRLDAIEPDAGWCDAPVHPAYNREVRHPFPASAERLWRDDALYDVVVVVGYNDAPVLPNVGSAIFCHIARPDFGPTEGCIAIGMEDMLRVLENVTEDTILRVEAPT